MPKRYAVFLDLETRERANKQANEQLCNRVRQANTCVQDQQGLLDCVHSCVSSHLWFDTDACGRVVRQCNNSGTSPKGYSNMGSCPWLIVIEQPLFE